jgi:hypothetical protein
MKLKTLTAVAAAGAFALPGAALAQSKPAAATQAGASSPGSALFSRLDRNKDGFVSRDEAKDTAELQGRFVELDKNNDGKISEAEMRALDAERSAAGGSKAKR